MRERRFRQLRRRMSISAQRRVMARLEKELAEYRKKDRQYMALRQVENVMADAETMLMLLDRAIAFLPDKH